MGWYVLGWLFTFLNIENRSLVVSRLKETTMEDKMRDAIFKVMSRHRNYSYEEIEDVFLRLRSYDKTIAAMQIASVFAVSLNRAAELIKTD